MGRAIPSDSHRRRRRRRKNENIKVNRAKCWCPFEPESEDPITQAQDLRSFTFQVCFDFHDPSRICFKWSEWLGFLNFRRAVLFLFFCVLMYISFYMCTHFYIALVSFLHLNLNFGLVGAKSMWVWFGLPFGFGNLLNQIWDKYDWYV